MRHNRSIRNRGKRRKKTVFDIDITSLLDILVILLVFLLQSYNSSGIVLNVPTGVELPLSESISLNTSGVMVQVSPTIIWVDDKEVFNSAVNDKRRAYDQSGRRLVPLFNELVKKRESIQQLEKSAPQAAKFSGVVNLIVDKSIRYSELKSILYTSAEAGFRQYKFVVLGEE